MSSCDSCRRAAEARSGALARLEDSAAPSALVRVELDAIAAEAASGGGAAGVEPGESIWSLCRHDSTFPDSLTHFEREADIPHVLYGHGRPELVATIDRRPAVALVGARRATAYGREVAYQLARDAAEAGIVVVSGMALGIDGAAHRGALQGGGETIAVLAGGVDRPYPRSHRLLYEQIAASGAVVSEMPPAVEAKRWSFVARNRLIAGLADLTVWVEGAENSGARHTVGFADELGKAVGVVPGPISSPMSAGPNALLSEAGALVIRSLADTFDSLGIREPEPARLADDPPEDGPGAALMRQIAAGHRGPRELAVALPELAPREISRLLGELELAGRVRRTSSGEYELTTGVPRD